MIKELRALYTVSTNNVVICFGTTVKETQEKFKEIQPKCRGYRYYLGKLKDGNLIKHKIGGREYYFQEVFKL